MSNRSFPCFRTSHKFNKQRGVCNCIGCEEPAFFHIEIEFSWFRGEDGVYKACGQHRDLAQKETNKFLRLLKKETANA